MKNSIFNAKSVTNYRELAKCTKGAKFEVNEVRKNIMYFVNNLNKMFRHGEFFAGENLAELGKKVRAKSIDLGHEVAANNPFNIYLFTKVNGTICYKYTKHVNTKSGAFAISEDVTTWKNVTLSESGLIDAYKYLLGIDAKAADKAAKEANKVANKAANKAAKDAKKALKEEQKQARIDYNNGKINIEQFAAIMAKVA